jgi:hypothetical protein
MRTTCPHTAAKALLFSQVIDPVLSFNGHLYHVRPRATKSDRESFQILSKTQALDYDVPNFRPGKTFSDFLGDWIASESQTWLASARLASSWDDPSTHINTALRTISNG